MLVADMDETVLATDMTVENLFGVLGRKPWMLPQVIGWVLSGRQVLKAELAKLAMPNVEHVPVNQECIEMIAKARAQGTITVLASASNQAIVDAVSERLGVFDYAHGSTETDNFKGQAKADFLNARYGTCCYDYMGDSPADLSVWRSAQRAITVGAPETLRRRAEAVNANAAHIDIASRDRGSYWRGLMRAMRPHQWSKNLLILVPMLAAQALSAENIGLALIAMAAFSLTASSVYIINDILDLDADRAHPRKRTRPFASGVVPIRDGLLLALMLLMTAAALSLALLPVLFSVILAIYFAATLAYSLFLKRKIMIDVFTLAGLYTCRIVAGGAALMVPMSPWLIGFSMFFFLALAIVKRLAELVDMIAAGEVARSKRDYGARDLGMVQALGAAAGFCAMIDISFYFSSDQAKLLYQSPEILWGVTPLLLYWISRMFVLANRGIMDDDPIVFAARDRTSILIGALVVFVILAAKFVDWRAFF